MKNFELALKHILVFPTDCDLRVTFYSTVTDYRHFGIIYRITDKLAGVVINLLIPIEKPQMRAVRDRFMQAS
jgi:hypothetical protein